MPSTPSRLSFHLRVLKEAGLVTDRREGRWMYYTLNAEKLADVADLAQTLATPLPPRADGCC
jgi:ArsR family transcriptional regulator